MSAYDFSVRTIDGNEISLSQYRGKVILIVNVASQCGFTSQYEGLEKMYLEFKPRGFEVLGFPCNQFGGQEPADEAGIKSFCETKFNVTFPLFSKIEVNGAKAHPLYEYLKREKKGLLGSAMIKWNFTKFLIDSTGSVRERFAPTTAPEAIAPKIEKLLQ